MSTNKNAYFLVRVSDVLICRHSARPRATVAWGPREIQGGLQVHHIACEEAGVGGMSLGDCTFFGRMAGAAAAARSPQDG